MAEERITATVRAQNISPTVTAAELLAFLESVIGEDTVFACEIFSERKNWKSKGHGRVQFETLDAKVRALTLSEEGKLLFRGYALRLSHSLNEVIYRPVDPNLRIPNGVLHTGFLGKQDCMTVLESWYGVKFWVMRERKAIEFWLTYGEDTYKLEVQFHDVLESCECSLNAQKSRAVLLKLKHAPKIHRKVSGTNVASKFGADRYHVCKEDFDFVWVRTTEFSGIKSIGLSSTLCLEMKGEFSMLGLLDPSKNLPYYNGDLLELNLEGAEVSISSDLVPLINCHPDLKLSYEILFQLNSLIHTQKLSLGAVDARLMEELNRLDWDTANLILQKMHKLPSMCYEPMLFINNTLHSMAEKGKGLASSLGNLKNNNMMKCHRVLVTPTKIYCMGPELETSNYVVRNFSKHASDFVRVTFVDEDWGKLSPGAVYTSLDRGLFAKNYRTNIYYRILSILKDGIVIGQKRFLFLAFSASQLRSNSVWMFASNDELRAEEIRDWMGCFNKIRSISKCAARMGQLFSTSVQTLEVPPQHVEVICDIEVITDGDTYCFSDGIGKISQAFARQVAQKCGLNHTPSAFQIRYGGYKGVLAVDRNSFRKISVRDSMHKFESKNRMLNVTKWNEAMPCYLNREIVTLLSTLGIEDQPFLELQDNQLQQLDKMLTNRDDAVDILASMGIKESKSIVVKMLLHGYEPCMEPYLSMMLQSYRENQLSDLRGRCRLFVPKGRILLGCLDETGILSYGQIYVRITLTKAEQLGGEKKFRITDDGTAIVTGKVVVTKNPCLHPGDVRVLEAVYEVALEEKGLFDCVIFPQKGDRPHPSECSGGDLDGDLYFVSWDESLIPCQMVAPMDYTDRRKRLVDHDVILEEIQKFFVDYMISDTLGTISTAHLVHADREPDKALSAKCLQLAALHSMAVDFAKTGSPAEMPQFLKPREFPDFMERWDKPMYTSQGVLGILYRATLASKIPWKSSFVFSAKFVQDAFDSELVVDGYEDYLEIAGIHKGMYIDKMSTLLTYYEGETEDEILTGNLRHKSAYLQRDNRRYGELKDRILVSSKSLQKEARGWFESHCKTADEHKKLASAWYYVTYHPTYCEGSVKCLGFPWIVGDILLAVKSNSSSMDFDLP
ncbi:OLC1v1008628C2 [Oldenlandia corymbosa var. corymbosa]|uniref:RNA-dependent RNA polymerase n=1 Tax=Oldenlandia corymbosa var. corymbosa TaxID=529605 RepID=A0AAV1DLY6_OLDCO|nr:OLC1v1008628C2 [Oldenlandia corymbosa var. corymbosa]